MSDNLGNGNVLKINKNDMKKRFQDCNKIEKAWRYRWYCAIPFVWLWHMTVKPFKVGIDAEDGSHTDKFDTIKGKNLWKLLLGIMQGKMRWYYTWDEVKARVLRSDLDHNGLNSVHKKTQRPKRL